MKIKLTLAQLIKLRDLVINELKSNQKALIKLNSVKEHNKEFSRKLLLELERIQKALREDLVNIKFEILSFNINADLQKKIFELSELKEEFKCYNKMNTNCIQRNEKGKIIKYVPILSRAIINEQLKYIEKKIVNITDILTEYNNKEILDINLLHIETFNIASKLQ